MIIIFLTIIILMTFLIYEFLKSFKCKGGNNVSLTIHYQKEQLKLNH